MSSGEQKKFRDPGALAEAAGQVAELAQLEGVRVALLGGLAMHLYGSDRLTGDVDFVSEGSLSSLPSGPLLSFGGVKTTAPNGVPVDLVVRSDDYAELYGEALDRAQALPEVPWLVVRPEYLAAMKMIAGRPRDENDLAHLILSGHLDLALAKAVIRRHLGPYAVTEFERTVEEVKWMASRGRI